VAQPGETVQVAGGTYPSQNIRAVAGKGAPNILFRPAQGARVIVGGISLGGSGDPNLGPRNITLRGIEMTYKGTAPGARNQRAIFVGPGSRYIRLEHIDAGSVDSWFADNLTVIGGDYGPCDAVAFASNVCGNNKQDLSTNVLIDGAIFHDLRFDSSCFSSGADCHWECMYINGGENITIRNSQFYQCALYDIFFTISGPDAGRVGHKNLVVENNWFSAPWTEYAGGGGKPERPTGISLAWCQNSTQGYQDVSVRFNSFAAGTGIELDGNQACTWKNVRITANLLQYPGGCDPRSIYAYNVWSTTWRTGKCGATDIIYGPSFPFASAAQSSLDYHIVGAPTALDNLVPSSIYAGCPATDRDGDARPIAVACDAGSDER
jgi:hypothetical protein